MKPATPSTRVRRSAVTVMLAAGAIGATMALTGCIQSAPPSNTPTGSSTPTRVATPTVTPTATAAAGIPVTLKCSAIFTPQQVYDYNPNYAANDNYKPVPSSLAALAGANQGRVCGWLNESSRATLAIAVARPGDLATLKTEAASGGTPVSLAGGAIGYFQTTAGVGQLQLFRGTFWVIISAADITEFNDAQPIATAVLGNIPAG